MESQLTNEEKLNFARAVKENDKTLRILAALKLIFKLLTICIFAFGVAGFFLDIPVPRLYLFLGCTAGSIIFDIISKSIIKSKQNKLIKRLSNGKVSYRKYRIMKKRGELSFLFQELYKQ